MSLGQREATDCLTVVLSMVDGNSHYYGPLSMETFDTLVRIDQALGAFFRFLDETVGADRYVVALTADHGFPEVPEYRQQTGLPGRRIRADEIEELLSQVRAESAREEASPDAAAGRIAALSARRDFVAAAYTAADLSLQDASDDPFVRLYRNSFRPDRIPRLPLFSLSTGRSAIGEAGVMLRLTEGTMIDIDVATHGSPYAYDRHVPMIFMGAGVAAGVSDLPVRTVDVAPTLARLAGLQVPAGLDGRAVLGDAPRR